jgi:hypothetical protein
VQRLQAFAADRLLRDELEPVLVGLRQLREVDVVAQL